MVLVAVAVTDSQRTLSDATETAARSAHFGCSVSQTLVSERRQALSPVQVFFSCQA